MPELRSLIISSEFFASLKTGTALSFGGSVGAMIQHQFLTPPENSELSRFFRSTDECLQARDVAMVLSSSAAVSRSQAPEVEPGQTEKSEFGEDGEGASGDRAPLAPSPSGAPNGPRKYYSDGVSSKSQRIWSTYWTPTGINCRWWVARNAVWDEEFGGVRKIEK